uniref:Uncharacterized protein n=1 Tax=Zea mays TaxID=4577 RepID=A0A804RD18_MAIZE
MSGGGDGGDKEAFFHCLDRVPSGLHLDADFPSDDEEDDEDDVRVSFTSAAGDQHFKSFRYQAAVPVEDDEDDDDDDDDDEDTSKYDMWMSDEPMSIQERRRRLHQGLGMASSRDLALRRHSMKKRPADVPRAMSRSVSRSKPPPSPIPANAASAANVPSTTSVAQAAAAAPRPAKEVITRRRSDSNLVVRDGASVSGKPPSQQPLRRVLSLPARPDARDSTPVVGKPQAGAPRGLPVVPPQAAPGIKGGKGDGDEGSKNNRDGEKEVAVVAASTPKDASSSTQQQTGVLGLEEFEKFIGNTPIMKLMRRGTSQNQPAPLPAGVPPKADKSGGKKKGGWLKNIKSVAIGFMQDKDANAKSGVVSAAAAVPKSVPTNASAGSAAPPAAGSERPKVHQYGKSSKELTGLYMCQEIQAHEGSIWSIKFSADGRWPPCPRSRPRGRAAAGTRSPSTSSSRTRCSRWLSSRRASSRATRTTCSTSPGPSPTSSCCRRRWTRRCGCGTRRARRASRRSRTATT